MSRVNDFKELDVWKKGRELVVLVYRATMKFPGGERNSLANQLQRAAVSIPSNISEGYGRGTRQEYIRGLRVARGSLCELETQVILAQDLGLIADTAPLQAIIRDEHRLLHGLLKALQEPRQGNEG